jgi:hypothetical protein
MLLAYLSLKKHLFDRRSYPTRPLTGRLAVPLDRIRTHTLALDFRMHIARAVPGDDNPHSGVILHHA